MQPDTVEYQQAMKEAKEEYDAWVNNKKKDRKWTKEKYRAQRLAKLHMMEMLSAKMIAA